MRSHDDWWARRQRNDARRLETRYFVYRLHDADGVVLYVGRSCNVAGRIRSHNSDATHQFSPDSARKALWFVDCRSVSMFGPFDWDGAVEAERLEIMRLAPVGNIQHTERDHRPVIARAAKETVA